MKQTGYKCDCGGDSKGKRPLVDTQGTTTRHSERNLPYHLGRKRCLPRLCDLLMHRLC